MFRTVSSNVAASCALALLLFSTAEAAHSPCLRPVSAAGTFHELRVPGADSTVPLAINDRGDVVGYYTTTDATYGFLWRRRTFSTILAPWATTTVASDINASGTIVGYTPTTSFILKRGTFIELDVPGSLATQANGINDAGVVAGFALEPNDFDGIEAGFVFRRGAFERVTHPDASGGTVLNDINARGTLLGNANGVGYFLRIGDRLATPRVCTPVTPATFTVLWRMIDRAGFVGTVFEEQTAGSSGFVFSKDRYTLYQYPGAQSTFLYDTNEHGVSVGEAFDGVGGHVGFVFVPKLK